MPSHTSHFLKLPTSVAFRCLLSEMTPGLFLPYWGNRIKGEIIVLAYHSLTH